MKKREMLKQLRAEAEETVPDVYDKVLTAANAEGLFAEETRVIPASRRNRSRLIARVAALCASAAVLCCAVVLPVVLRGGENTPSFPAKELTVNDVYGIGAVTSVGILGRERKSASVVAASFSRPATEGGGERAYLEKFNEYFSSLDCFLGGDTVETVAIRNPDTEGAYARYSVKMTVTGVNIGGISVVHTMYYTEKPVSEKSNGKETESEYTLEGVMLVDGCDYVLYGERSCESDRKETESELKIRAYSPDEPRTYVEMSQEISEEAGETEKEYVYRVYDNNELVEETAIEFESESKGDKEKTKFKLDFRQGEIKGRYRIECENKGGKTDIRVRYETDGEEEEFSVRLNEAGEHEYVFPDGTVWKY